MRGFFIIARRELFAQFLSPVSWLLMTLVWLVFGIYFRFEVLQRSSDILWMLQQAVLLALWLQLLLVPLQTMRLVSEEKRSGTFEMLVTTPVRDHEIVLGKFLGAWVFNALIWMVIPAYAFVISKSGGDPDFGPVWTSYLAVIASGALYVAAGLMASSTTRHQFLAGFIGIVTLLMVGQLPRLWSALPDEGLASLLRDVLRTGDLYYQMDQASRGLLDLVHLTYKLAFCGLFLLYTTRILETRKWV